MTHRYNIYIHADRQNYIHHIHTVIQEGTCSVLVQCMSLWGFKYSMHTCTVLYCMCKQYVCTIHIVMSVVVVVEDVVGVVVEVVVVQSTSSCWLSVIVIVNVVQKEGEDVVIFVVLSAVPPVSVVLMIHRCLSYYVHYVNPNTVLVSELENSLIDTSMIQSCVWIVVTDSVML